MNNYRSIQGIENSNFHYSSFCFDLSLLKSKITSKYRKLSVNRPTSLIMNRIGCDLSSYD